MNTASILIKTDPQLKEKAQKTAESMGISLTSVINHYLKHFIQTKSITLTIDEGVPNEYMANAIRQSEEDYKAGRFISFDKKKEVHSYLDEILSQYFIVSIKESEADVKAGRVSPTFDNAKDAIAWLENPKSKL